MMYLIDKHDMDAPYTGAEIQALHDFLAQNFIRPMYKEITRHESVLIVGSSYKVGRNMSLLVAVGRWYTVCRGKGPTKAQGEGPTRAQGETPITT